MTKAVSVAGLMLAVTLAGCKQTQVPVGEQGAGDAREELSELAAVMQAGGSMACTMTNTEGEVVEYWVMGEKMRASGIQDAEEGRVSTIINDGEYVYTWVEGGTEGMKFAVASTEAMAAEAEEVMQSVPDLQTEEDVAYYEDQGYTIDCEPRNLSASDFVPPSEVTFVDMAELLQGFTGLQESTDGTGLTPEMQEQLQQLQQQFGE